MTISALHGSTFLTAGQSQSEILVNDFLGRLETLSSGVVEVIGNNPPGSPAEGQAYAIAGAPTGVWTGKANHIAVYFNGWIFIENFPGLSVFNRTDERRVSWNGSIWLDIPIRGTTNVALLNQTISGPTETEVQDISDKVDELLGELRNSKVIT